MPALYEINTAILHILQNDAHVDEETGEFFDVSDLDALEMAFNEKAENVACYIKGLEADAAAIKAEEKALADRRRAIEKRAEHLREYLAYNMQANGLTKLETPRAALSFRKSKSVDIVDESELPAQYLAQKITTTPNKKAIGDALKNGVSVPGAALIEKNNLQLK